jgi:ferrous iron transport protein B
LPAPFPASWHARTIDNERDRLTTIMVAPLMTCSARLPVYTLLIAAFIPERHYVGGPFNLQGLVLFALYMARHHQRDRRRLRAQAHRH